ncbi:Hint domain-containing protein [Paracoccus sp. (in: a-proteobacteria)]|uniref:Hint domain-containing protein n=1 Tax=Paracoccus sp. TaxID=267 RepID=UPI003A8AF243
MALTTINTIAYKYSDFQYWDGTKWVAAVNSTQVVSQSYVRLKPGSVMLHATITDDDAYLNDRSGDAGSPAGEEENTAYIQHLEITDSAGNVVMSSRPFSADTESVNAPISVADATLTPTDDTYDPTRLMDMYTVVTFAEGASWTATSGNTSQPYILFGLHAPRPGEIYHNGAFNGSASDTGGYGYDPSVVGQLDTLLICFASGTLIETIDGPKPVEMIRQGDTVLTRDHGFKPVFWTGKQTRRLSGKAGDDRFYPVRIRAGALGDGHPDRDLYVSQQHRILIRSPIAREMFGADEILVAAKKLTLIDGIDIVDQCDEVTYVHLLFDQHELVYSNGTETESLFTGPEALKAVDTEARREILDLFPELASMDYKAQPARLVPSGKLTRELVGLHLRQHQQLYAQQ